MSDRAEWLLPSVAETRRLAAALGRVVRAGDHIALVGDLGAGKTHFVQGLGHGLDVPDVGEITSPTFALLNEICGGRVPLVHGDLYRIEDERELDHLGIYELCDDHRVVAIEWADKFPVLAGDHLTIRMTIEGSERRHLSASGGGPRSSELLALWQQSDAQ